MKKTFRRRAPRKGTTRKRTHGGRKLRKMRGGFDEIEHETYYEIVFDEKEKAEILKNKDLGLDVGVIRDKIFKHHMNNQTKKNFNTAIQIVLGQQIGLR